jgi:hypothetical protein
MVGTVGAMANWAAFRLSFVARSVSILIVPAHPLHREFEAVLIAAFGHEVEVMIGAVEHVNAPRVAGIGVEHLASLIFVEDAHSNLVVR